MILVDPSVIADILTRDLDWFEWSRAQIEHWAEAGPVCYDTRARRANRRLVSDEGSLLAFCQQASRLTNSGPLQLRTAYFS